jgi:hypothetical protein
MKLKEGNGFLVLCFKRILRGIKKPMIFGLVLLMFLGSFFSTFSFIPLAKQAKAAGTTYYVDGSVGSSGNGLSWGTAFKTINEGRTAAQNPGDTVEISGGTYHQYVTINAASGTVGNYITFKGSSAIGHNSPVIIDEGGSSSNDLYVSKNYIWIENITVQNTDTNSYGLYTAATSDNVVFNKVTSQNNWTDARFIGTNVTVSNCLFKGAAVESVRMDSTSSGTIQNTIFQNSNTLTNKYSRDLSTHTWNIYNSLITNVDSTQAITNESTGTLNISNSVIFGSQGLNGVAYYTIDSTGGGVVNLSYSLVLPSVYNTAYYLRGVTQGSGNLSQNPRLTAYSKQGYISFDVDDANLDYAEQVAAILNPYGIPITFYVIEHDIQLVTNWQSRLQALVNEGNEIGIHSYSHSDLSLTTAFSVTGTGTTPTVQVDRTNDRIRLYDTQHGNQDITGFREMSLSQIQTAINGKADFSAGTLSTNLSPNSLGEDLANLAPTSCSTAVLLNLDLATDGSEGYYKVEIFDPKTWLQSVLPGYTAQTFTFPYDTPSASGLTAVENAGYIGARANSSSYLNNFSIFNIRTYGYQNIIAGGDSNIPSNVATLCVDAAQSGQFIPVLSHDTSNLSLSEVTQFAQALSQCGGIDYSKTNAQVYNYIRTSGLWSTADSGVTWTRTYTDTSNYLPLSTSPLIDAGVDLNINTDYAGKQRYDDPAVADTGSVGSYSKNYVDIGAYEYVTPPVPGLSSATHPSQVAWYSSATPQITVSPTSSTTTYKYTVDQTLATTLGSVLAGTASASATFTVAGGVITSDGTWYVHVAALNLDGDSSTTYATYTINYDATAPVAFVPTVATSSWTNALAMTVNFATTDASSGVASYLVKIDGGAYINNVTSPYNLDISTTADGAHTVTVKAIDNAGNYTEETAGTILLDKTPPTLGITVSSAAIPSITLSATDSSSGVLAIYYHWGSGADMIYSSSITAPIGTHTLSYYAVDNAGNISAVATRAFIVATTTTSLVTLSTPTQSQSSNLKVQSSPTPTPSPTASESTLTKIEKFFETKIAEINGQKVVEQVKFQIVDKNGNSIPNLAVTIHSDSQTATTDENGVVTFSNIAVGKHILVFTTAGETFNKRVSIADSSVSTGTFQAQILVVKAEKDATATWVWIVIGLLAVLVLIFGSALYMRRRRTI